MPAPQGYYVYMLECADGTLYTGWTRDVGRRAAAHNAGRGAKYTRGRGPVRVVWVEEAADRSQALRREAAVKGLSRREKLALAETFKGSPALTSGEKVVYCSHNIHKLHRTEVPSPMKLMFASDIHGSLYWAKKLREAWQREAPAKLILLGDLLYHGPRNPLPREYDPQGVADLLAGMKQELLCVRGNCEAEVDQMVLPFPVMADYMALWLDGPMAFVTHGHLFNEGSLPMLKRGDFLVHGHTHVPTIRWHREEGYTYLNPGSVSIPKENSPNSYMIYEDGRFSIRFLKNGEEFLGKTAGEEGE